MRKQCLFDPNHLIDELGFTKHLLNCHSKLKKDWKKCRYSDSHWQLYKYIDFHERYECPYNPLCIQNPQKFAQERQKEIMKRISKTQQKNSSKVQSFLTQIQQNSQPNSATESFFEDSHHQSINFGQISIIERSKNQNLTHQKIDSSNSKNIQNIFQSNFHEVLDVNETAIDFDFSQKISVKNEENSNMLSIILTDDQQQNFESGIFKKQSKLWIEPDFERFEKQFRSKWFANKEKMSKRQKIGQWKKEESFSEQDEDEITIENIQQKYLTIDED